MDTDRTTITNITALQILQLYPRICYITNMDTECNDRYTGPRPSAGASAYYYSTTLLIITNTALSNATLISVTMGIQMIMLPGRPDRPYINVSSLLSLFILVVLAH